jgi:membrane associated rhomboid family serine protease
MFPIRDDNPNILVPYTTYAIVIVNILAWVFAQGMGMEPQLSGSVCRLGLIPGELLGGLSNYSAIELGPNNLCPINESSAWLTPFTSMFMHGGWLHIIGNMWFLWVFGDNVEDSMGHFRFAIFYLLCGLAAAALQIIADPDSAIPMVGASGAIGGVMGAYVLLYPRVHVHMLLILGFFVTTIAVPAILMLGYWFVIQLVSGFVSIGGQGGGVAFWAHVGGFVGGAVLVLIFKDKKLLDRHPYHGWNRRDTATRNWRRVNGR